MPYVRYVMTFLCTWCYFTVSSLSDCRTKRWTPSLSAPNTLLGMNFLVSRFDDDPCVLQNVGSILTGSCLLQRISTASGDGKALLLTRILRALLTLKISVECLTTAVSQFPINKQRIIWPMSWLWLFRCLFCRRHHSANAFTSIRAIVMDKTFPTLFLQVFASLFSSTYCLRSHYTRYTYL